MSEQDWLSTKSEAEQLKDLERQQLEREFSELYLATFVRNPAGAAILARWTSVFAKRRTATNAPHTEYAANEALRAFVEDIHAQISFAQSPGGLSRGN